MRVRRRKSVLHRGCCQSLPIPIGWNLGRTKDGWQSGRLRTPGKRVYRKVPGVRIPPHPPVPPLRMNTPIAEDIRTVDRMLNLWLPKESAKPVTIHRAMRYSIFAGGKRMRPVLCLAAARACGIRRAAEALPAACAVECVHTYSLIHDDLPCMDDDDMRRGRPTSHKVFGEGIAVLAGDALLTVAFEILARIKPTPRYSAGDFVTELARAAGSRFLVGGQVADLEGEKKKITPAELRFIHRGKTAAMMIASLKLGAMAADATPSELGIL